MKIRRHQEKQSVDKGLLKTERYDRKVGVIRIWRVGMKKLLFISLVSGLIGYVVGYVNGYHIEVVDPYSSAKR